MRFEEMFGGAEWIGAPEGSGYIAIRDRFSARKGEKAIIRILGFGHFVLFINGSRAHDELFLPLCTNYENVERKGVPTDEEMATRCYVSEFDISHLLCDGENSVAVLLGGGWYTGSDTFAGATQGAFGEPKLIDPMDGSVYCLSELYEDLGHGLYKFNNIPIKDYPLLIAFGGFI